MIEAARAVQRIETLRVKNYRALLDVTMTEITPLTVLLGPNGSGKSTVFDVFAFLAECFADGIRRAWDKRGRFRQLRSRGGKGPIAIELRYKESRKATPITYHVEIDEGPRGPYVAREYMHWTRGASGKPFRFLDYAQGRGEVISGEAPERQDQRIQVPLAGPDVLAVSTLGQLAGNPRVQALREFITGWHLSYLSAAAARGNPEAGAQERLSQTGDNLPNVIQYLREQHPNRLDAIFATLRRRVPRLERFDAEVLPDGRLLLALKDAPFVEPVLARYASDGTLKLLAYLVQLYDPAPPPLIGIEEPENFLHPALLVTSVKEVEIRAGCESWLLGDVPALRACFPRVSVGLSRRRDMRNSEKITNAWEKLHRLLRRAGELGNVYPKIDVARRVAAHLDPTRNRSRSFQVFRDGMEALLAP
jgi:predicted ATPase